MKRVHIVPLSKQAIEILRFLKEITGKENWIFPSAGMDSRPMSENTVKIALVSSDVHFLNRTGNATDLDSNIFQRYFLAERGLND